MLTSLNQRSHANSLRFCFVLSTDAGTDMPDSTRALMGKLKKSLKKRGADGIAGLARKFRIVDDDGSGELDPDEVGETTGGGNKHKSTTLHHTQCTNARRNPIGTT